MDVDGKPIPYEKLPERARLDMVRYIEDHVKPPRFLHAVLCNNLLNACANADDLDRRLLFDYVRWLYNFAPTEAYGEKAKVDAWISHGLDKMKQA